MVSKGYEEVDHTADLALKVRGEDFFELLENAVEGMYELMGIKLDPEADVEHSFQIEHDQPDLILVDFLNECLFLADVEHQRFTSFLFQNGEEELDVKAHGKTIQAINRNIKAVTFHNLEIEETSSGLETIITFDV